MFKIFIKNPIYHNVRATNKTVLDRFLQLPVERSKTVVTYVWIDGTGKNLRSKEMTVDHEPKEVDDLPWWNFDGSSTGQAEGENSDVYMKPVALFRDPFKQHKNKIVFCETYNHKKDPTKTNKRAKIVEQMSKTGEHEPIFNIEQEYTLLGPNEWPHGWPSNYGFSEPNQNYYGSVGTKHAIGRDVAIAHYKACLYAGINITSFTAGEQPSQWKFSIKSNGLNAADHLWMARYILHRVAEDFGITATFDTKITAKNANLKKNGAYIRFKTSKVLNNYEENCPVKNAIAAFLDSI